MTPAQRADPDGRFRAIIVLAGFCLALATGHRGQAWSVACYATNNCDALTFAVAGELIRSGRSPYSSAERTAHVAQTRLAGKQPPFDLPFQYPPYSFPLFALLSLLPGETGFLVWVAVTTLFLLVQLSHLIARQELGNRGYVLLAGIGLSGFEILNSVLGQTGALVGGLAAGAVLSWKSRPLVAGALIGLLSIKPHYALPLFILAAVRRDGLVLAGASASLAGLGIASALLFGFHHWPDFIAGLGEPNATLPFMVSWVGFLTRVAPGVNLEPRLTIGVFAVSMVLIAVALAYWGARESTVATQAGSVLAWTLIASPNTHPYDLLLLGPTLITIGRFRSPLMVGLSCLLISWIAIWPPARWLLSISLFGCAMLCTWTAVEERRRDHESSL